MTEFKHFDDIWLYPWETKDLKEQVARLWEDLKPLYELIHAYVRKHLREQYKDIMPKDGTIPANLLGNMWAQSWSNTLKTVKGVDPYPDLESIDVTDKLKELVWSNLIMMLYYFFFYQSELYCRKNVCTF